MVGHQLAQMLDVAGYDEQRLDFLQGSFNFPRYQLVNIHETEVVPVLGILCSCLRRWVQQGPGVHIYRSCRGSPWGFSRKVKYSWPCF